LKKFTLIELLIVVSITAILAGMLLPALNNARLIARSSQCRGNLRSLTQAATQYSGDHNDYSVHLSLSSRNPSGWWPTSLRSYLGLAPVSTGASEGWGTSGGRGLYCPNAPYDTENANGCIGRSYGVVSAASFSNWTSNANNPSYWNVKLSTLRNPSNHFYFLDGKNALLNYAISAISYYQYIQERDPESGYVNVTAYRHNKRADVGYYDCHSANLSAGEIYTGATINSSWSYEK
jgi:type II secretory pathway pseudopilin PulG